MISDHGMYNLLLGLIPAKIGNTVAFLDYVRSKFSTQLGRKEIVQLSVPNFDAFGIEMVIIKKV